MKKRRMRKLQNVALYESTLRFFQRQLSYGINKKNKLIITKGKNKTGKESISLKMKSCRKENSCCLKVSRENKREEKFSIQQENSKKANFYLPKIEFSSFAIFLIFFFLA